MITLKVERSQKELVRYAGFLLEISFWLDNYSGVFMFDENGYLTQYDDNTDSYYKSMHKWTDFVGETIHYELTYKEETMLKNLYLSGYDHLVIYPNEDPESSSSAVIEAMDSNDKPLVISDRYFKVLRSGVKSKRRIKLQSILLSDDINLLEKGTYKDLSLSNNITAYNQVLKLYNKGYRWLYKTTQLSPVKAYKSLPDWSNDNTPYNGTLEQGILDLTTYDHPPVSIMSILIESGTNPYEIGYGVDQKLTEKFLKSKKEN